MTEFAPPSSTITRWKSRAHNLIVSRNTSGSFGGTRNAVGIRADQRVFSKIIPQSKPRLNIDDQIVNSICSRPDHCVKRSFNRILLVY